jgi:hypothetical protein
VCDSGIISNEDAATSDFLCNFDKRKILQTEIRNVQWHLAWAEKNDRFRHGLCEFCEPRPDLRQTSASWMKQYPSGSLLPEVREFGVWETERLQKVIGGMPGRRKWIRVKNFRNS